MTGRLLLAMTIAVLTRHEVPASAAETADSLTIKARGVLAQLEGEIKTPGVTEPVEVLRDRWGVAHIYARNANDLFFAQGFVVAQDRLFQIDMWRRVAVGETAEVLGKRALDGDRFARLLKYRGDIEAEWISYSPDTKQIATAFTRGINAYIDHVGDRLPIEFQVLGVKPKKWRPEDVLGRMSGIIMTSNFRNEILRAELVAAVGVEKARWIAPTDPPRDYRPAPGLDLAGIDRSVLAGYDGATRPLTPTPLPRGERGQLFSPLPREERGQLFSPLPRGERGQLYSPLSPQGRGVGGEGSEEGSNNWVIDGTLSASGKPMLASDPHRAILLPSLRYLVHLNAPGWNVIGSGEPALPGVAIGHNERVAWGFTIVGTDQADIYVEETNPDDASEYRVGERWEKMKVIREKVGVRGESAPVDLELRFTRHGPVIHQDAKRRRAFALRWVGGEPGSAAYLGSLAIGRTRNQREFVEALKAWKMPALNMVHADVDGHIGWVAAGLTPIRQGWDGLLPVPGAPGNYEWQGFLPVKDLPLSFNPPNHFLATANHNILPPGYAHEISYEWATSYRYARIKERLEAKEKFTREDFQSIQHDNTSIPGRTLARLLKNSELKEETLQPFIDMMSAWNGELSRESKVGPLYAVWLQELLDGFYRPHVPGRLLEFVRSRGGVTVMLAALEKPDRNWFGDDPAAGRDRLLRQTFARAVAKAKKLLGSDANQWAWGKLHTATFRHPLATLGPAYAKAFNLGPVPRPGDGLTPNATAHNPRFDQIAGASYRHVFDLADWDKGLATNTPGQSGQPGSLHYGDLLTLWAQDQYFPLAYSRKKVEEVTKHRLLLKPNRP